MGRSLGGDGGQVKGRERGSGWEVAFGMGRGLKLGGVFVFGGIRELAQVSRVSGFEEGEKGGEKGRSSPPNPPNTPPGMCFRKEQALPFATASSNVSIKLVMDDCKLAR